MSFEGISASFLFDNDLQAFYAYITYLKRIFQKITFLCFLRPVDGFINSIYNQRVKKGYFRPIKKLISESANQVPWAFDGKKSPLFIHNNNQKFDLRRFDLDALEISLGKFNIPILYFNIHALSLNEIFGKIEIDICAVKSNANRSLAYHSLCIMRIFNLLLYVGFLPLKILFGSTLADLLVKKIWFRIMLCIKNLDQVFVRINFCGARPALDQLSGNVQLEMVRIEKQIEQRTGFRD